MSTPPPSQSSTRPGKAEFFFLFLTIIVFILGIFLAGGSVYWMFRDQTAPIILWFTLIFGDMGGFVGFTLKYIPPSLQKVHGLNAGG